MNMTPELVWSHNCQIYYEKNVVLDTFSFVVLWSIWLSRNEFAFREEAGQPWIWSGTRWWQSLEEGQCFARMHVLLKSPVSLCLMIELQHFNWILYETYFGLHVNWTNGQYIFSTKFIKYTTYTKNLLAKTLIAGVTNMKNKEHHD
jgi:hypothetical protein